MKKLNGLDFSVRALNTFKSLGFNYLEDFKPLTENKLRLLGMSKKTIQEVVSVVNLEYKPIQTWEGMALAFHKWMRENDTQENADQWFGFSDEDMLNAFKETL